MRQHFTQLRHTTLHPTPSNDTSPNSVKQHFTQHRQATLHPTLSGNTSPNTVKQHFTQLCQALHHEHVLLRHTNPRVLLRHTNPRVLLRNTNPRALLRHTNPRVLLRHVVYDALVMGAGTSPELDVLQGLVSITHHSRHLLVCILARGGRLASCVQSN